MPDTHPPLPEAASADPRAPIGRNRQFRLLYAALLVVGAGNSMLLAVTPSIVRELGLPDSSIGWIFSLSAVLWVFSSPTWGRVSDRAGRKPIAALGLAAYAVSMAGFAAFVLAGYAGWIGAVALFWGLMLARAIFGAFGSAASPAAQAYVADRTSVFERTERLAALGSAFAVGQAFGPGICAALAARLGLVFPIALVAVLAAAVSFAIWRFLPENTPPQTERARGGWRTLTALAGDRRLSAFLLYGLGLSTLAGVSVQVFGLFTMDRLKVEGAEGAELVGAGFMVSALAMLATQMGLLPRLKLNSRELMLWGAALLGLGVVAQILASGLGAILASQALQGVGFGLARSGFTGGASIAVTPREQGAAAGLVVAVNGAGFIVSPVLGGVAYERIGMNAPLAIMLAILGVMLAFAWRSRRLRNAVIAQAPHDLAGP